MRNKPSEGSIINILITGATGFIGRFFLAALTPIHKVYALGRGTRPGDLADEVEWIQQDLANSLQTDSLPDHMDTIVHLAQSRNYPHFPDYANEIYAINVQSTMHLLEYARQSGCQRFVYASSGSVYGYHPHPIIESTPVSPPDFYASTKHISEVLIGNYVKFFHTIILRIFVAYGPGQEHRLVSSLFQKVKRGEPITIQGNPGLAINPIHVSDIVRVLVSAVTLNRAGIYNVSGDETITISELIARMEEILNIKVAKIYTPTEITSCLLGDNTKMKSELGLVPRIDLSTGLKSLQTFKYSEL